MTHLDVSRSDSKALHGFHFCRSWPRTLDFEVAPDLGAFWGHMVSRAISVHLGLRDLSVLTWLSEGGGLSSPIRSLSKNTKMTKVVTLRSQSKEGQMSLQTFLA